MRCALDLGAAGWLVEAGDLDGARRVLESALGNSPHDVRSRALLAQVLFRKRDFVAASEVYERLLAEFPGDQALTFNVALCHLKSGRPGAAAAGLRSILDKFPDHPRARMWLRAAEAATPVPPAPSIRPASRPVSVRPDGVEDIPRITLRPRTAVAKDANGIVSLRVDRDNRWLVRPDVIQGYEGEVALGAGAGPLVPLQGNGTTFLRSKGGLFVLELRSEEAYVRASSLVAHTEGAMPSSTDPEVIGAFDEPILHFSGDGEVVLEARADLVALPVSLTHATTVRWDNLVAWRGHVIGAPSDTLGPDGRSLARFAGNGSLLLATHDDGANAPVVQSQEWYGRYQVLRRLEGTPTEEVLLARAHGPGGFQRKVVLRRHLSRCDGDSHYLQLLAREADAYALLTHPGIVRLYDFLLLDGHPVLVLEYVSGLSLSAFDAVIREGVRRVGVEIALYVAHGVFSALAAAHEAREPDTGDLAPVIHRDVRPENVMLSWAADVKLGSFGAAKIGARAEPRHTLRADVAAASLLLYRMLISGRVSDPSLPKLEIPRGPGEENFDDLDASRPELSPRLRDALRSALAPRDDGRGLSAWEMAQEIEAAVDLRKAREELFEELCTLRESTFRDRTTSRPPPAVAGFEDSDFFRSMRLPKPSPVPNISPDPWPADGAETPAAPSAANAPRASSVPAPRAGRAVSEPPAAGARATSIPPRESPSSVRPPLVSLPPPSVGLGLQPSSLAPTETQVASVRPFPAGRRLSTGLALGALAVAAGFAAFLGTSTSRPNDRPSAAAAPMRPLPRPTAVRTPEVALPVMQIPSSIPSATKTASDGEPAAIAPIASDEGVLHAPARAAQHRIYVDERVIGEGPGDYRVHCGVHTVRIGSKGDDVETKVPCGGTVDID